YDLESSLQYPAHMALERRQEIAQAFAFRDAARPMLTEPAKHTKALQALSRKIAYHLESQAPTPFREAGQLGRRQGEGGPPRRGPERRPRGSARRGRRRRGAGGACPGLRGRPADDEGVGQAGLVEGKADLVSLLSPGVLHGRGAAALRAADPGRVRSAADGR